MGCNSSKSTFTSNHQESVKRTWQAFTTAENAEKGVAWFACVFENHPNLTKTWGDTKREEFIKLTVDAIDVVVANVHKLNCIVNTVNQLGPVKADATGDIDALQAVINTILIALESGLTEHFVDDVKIGWTYVLDILKASMVRRIELAKSGESAQAGDAGNAETVVTAADTKSLKSGKSVKSGKSAKTPEPDAVSNVSEAGAGDTTVQVPVQAET